MYLLWRGAVPVSWLSRSKTSAVIYAVFTCTYFVGCAMFSFKINPLSPRSDLKFHSV